jgi:hypothetical protein
MEGSKLSPWNSWHNPLCCLSLPGTFDGRFWEFSTTGYKEWYTLVARIAWKEWAKACGRSPHKCTWLYISILFFAWIVFPPIVHNCFAQWHPIKFWWFLCKQLCEMFCPCKNEANFGLKAKNNEHRCQRVYIQKSLTFWRLMQCKKIQCFPLLVNAHNQFSSL